MIAYLYFKQKFLKLSSLLVSIFIKSKNKILRYSMMDKDNFLYNQKAKDMAEVSFSHAFVKNVAVRILFFEGSRTFVRRRTKKIRSKIKLCLLWFWSSDKSVLWGKWRRRDFYPPKNRSHGIPSRERFRFMFESVDMDQDISWKWWRIHSLKLDTYILTSSQERRRTMLY